MELVHGPVPCCTGTRRICWLDELACDELLCCSDARMKQAVDGVKDTVVPNLQSQGMSFAAAIVAIQVDVVDLDGPEAETSVAILEYLLSVTIHGLVIGKGDEVDSLGNNSIDS